MGNATDRRTALYRIWGDGGRLLYIGISVDFGRRWKSHAGSQPWWGEMRRLSVDEWYDSREDAEQAETVAIKAEGPKYNQVHAVPAGRPQREPKPLDQSKSTPGLPTPYRECHCRDPQTRKTLHRNCPKLREKTHGDWYARYTIPEGTPGWVPDGNRKRRIGPFASEKEAKDELLRILLGFQQAGHRVPRLMAARRALGVPKSPVTVGQFTFDDLEAQSH